MVTDISQQAQLLLDPLPRCVQVVSTDLALPIAERVQICQVAREPLQSGQVRIGMMAMTINPADLLQVDGRYGVKPPLPYLPGHEGVALVLEVAPDVRDLVVGDHVLPMAPGGCWVDERVVSRRFLVSIPVTADVLQCAMLTANPATAWILLRHMRKLESGDWLIQNAANSAVGQSVRQMAQTVGLRVANIVRRIDAIGQPDTRDSVWVVDTGLSGPALRDKVLQATGGEMPRLALDAVGGQSSSGLAHCLADGSLLVVFGLLSGRPCEVPAHDLVFRDLRVQGFWLANWFANAENRSLTRSLYPELVAMVKAGNLKMDVEAVYPLEKVHEALAPAGRSGRSGKVLLKGAWMDRVVART
jgi:NADPH:quinone reductase-like Zn-dependent oxidoreductase